MLYVVDAQRDFMLPDGALYVKGAEEIIPNITALVTQAIHRKHIVCLSMDAHTKDDPEFRKFPPHCVVNTQGQKFVEPLHSFQVLLGDYRDVFEKQTIDVFDTEKGQRQLTAEKVGYAIVCGVATEYCVRAAVLGMLARGIRVFLVEDAIRGVDFVAARMASTEMWNAGATRISVQEAMMMM